MQLGAKNMIIGASGTVTHSIMQYSTPKPIDQSFADWETHVFGFSYGSGEEYVLGSLKGFLAVTPADVAYDYQELEQAIGPIPTWLLINILCRHGVGILEYGTSPRFAWLTPCGQRLKSYIDAHTVQELGAATSRDEHYIHCMPDACNCGPEGYDPRLVCSNPFWTNQWPPAAR